jgi:hypothetical protein
MLQNNIGLKQHKTEPMALRNCVAIGKDCQRKGHVTKWIYFLAKQDGANLLLVEIGLKQHKTERPAFRNCVAIGKEWEGGGGSCYKLNEFCCKATHLTHKKCAAHRDIQCVATTEFVWLESLCYSSRRRSMGILALATKILRIFPWNTI